MPTLYEFCNTGTTTFTTSIYAAEWIGQSFTPSASHKLESLKIKLFRGGTPGTLTASIRATSTGGTPTGSDLISGTTNGDTLPVGESNAEWREITLGNGYNLSANTKYAIVLRCPSGTTGNAVSNIGVSSIYVGGDEQYSSNSGSTWITNVDDDIQFEDWGTTGFVPKVVIM